jgi:hypothetical protein
MNKRNMATDLRDSVLAATKKYTKTIKAEERNPAKRQFRMQRMTYERGVFFKEAAYEVMEQAYLMASGDGQYPANARQIMYAARPHIQKETGKDLGDSYFTQTLLPNYIEEFECDWDVVFDARGHFQEPHSYRANSYGLFGVGTLEVRRYLAAHKVPLIVPARLTQVDVKTVGPDGNFGAVLFIEKEGFAPLLERSRIADRFDIAIMSTKGMSVTGARQLVDEMCAEYDIPLLILHDFDKAGFSIAGTLKRDTDRYEFKNYIKVTDLGLSLADVQAMGLQHEYQHHPKADRPVMENNMRLNGANTADIEFMFRDFNNMSSTRRVELNAMTSPEFIEFLERKLVENGVKKIIPDRASLEDVFVQMDKGRQLQAAFAKLEKEFKFEKREVPADIERRIGEILAKDPTLRWDAAVAKIVGGGFDPSTSSGVETSPEISIEQVERMAREVENDGDES